MPKNFCQQGQTGRRSSLTRSPMRSRISRVRLGDDLTSWSWGRLHRTYSPHTLSDAFPELSELLDPPSVAMGGDGEVPRSCGFLVNNPFVITGMPVARYVVDPSDWDNSGWVIPLGSSGHPGSKHYRDQQPLWANYELVPMTYTWGHGAGYSRDGSDT